MPGKVGVNGPESAVAVGGGPGAPGVRGWAGLVKAGGPEQTASSGPKTVNVTVPVGEGPLADPVTVAVSEIAPPTTAVGVAWVAMVARAWTTTDVSDGSPQALLTVS